MNPGYFQLQRRFFSHWLWQEKRSLSKAEAFLDLLQLAPFADTKRIVQGKLIELEQGEIVASVRYLSARWTWGKDKVATYLRLLESDGMIRRETRQAETIIIICKYKSYNSSPDSKPDSNPPPGQTAGRQRADKVEEEKEGKELKEKKSLPLPFPSEAFGEAWTSWTKHRKEIRKPLTETSIKTQFAQFQQWGEDRSIKAMLHTIRKGWQGLREPEIRDMIQPPPSYKEVEDYGKANKQPTAAIEEFFDRMEKSGWHDRNGPIVDWRAAMRFSCEKWHEFNNRAAR